MKFFHLSDLHIGLRLMNRDLREDQAYIFDRIAAYAQQEQPDAILIAGDIYDKAIPSAEAVELFDRFVLRCLEAAPKAELMMISGNHDSAQRLNVYRQILARQRVHVIGLPPQGPEEHIEKVVLKDAFGPVNFYLLPFVRPSMMRTVLGAREDGSSFSYHETLRRLLKREAIDERQRNVLVSHQFYLPKGADPEAVERMDSEVRTLGNIDAVEADVLEPFDYAALGHIHKPMQAGDKRFRYCGTPLSCSVSEAGQQKGILMVELMEKGSLQVTSLPLTPLRQVRIIKGRLEEVLREACGDYVTVVLTDKADLDVMDMQDRLHHAFPMLLEIRREVLQQRRELASQELEPELGPLALCSRFLGEGLSPEEEKLLQDVINSVQGVE